MNHPVQIAGSQSKNMTTSPKGHSTSPNGSGALQKYLDNHVQRLQNDIDSTTRKMEIEKRRLHELRENLRRSKEEFEEKRNKYGAPKGSVSEDLKRQSVSVCISVFIYVIFRIN